MIALFYYILKVILCSGILYGYYHFALRNKVFHEWNRFYLLAAIPVSILLPLVNINIIAPADHNSRIITALEIVSGADEYMLEVNKSAGINWSTELISVLIYLGVSTVLALIFLVGIFRVMKMIRKYQPVLLDNFYFINSNEPGTPFSFFRFLLWNREISLASENGKRILEHELVHIREKHSWDKIYLHITLIIFWINPFFWMVRQELSMIHEFIADRKSVGNGDVDAFAKLILQASFPGHSGLLTSAFFQSSIKRRLAMITKKNNPMVMYVSRLMMIPLVFLLVFAFAVKAKTLMLNDIPASPKFDQKYTVIIDAGHGGDDAGAMAGGMKEKEINLQLAQMVKELNKNSSLELILTRQGDQSTALPDRVKVAKDKNAQLFLSIHVSSAPSEKEKGIRAFISKNDLSYYNKNVRFANLLLNNLSSVYTVDKNIRQRETTGIWVLDKNVCPAVILECGYISNSDDRAYISSKANQEKIAKEILGAIDDYFSKTVLIQSTAPVLSTAAPTKQKDTVPKSKVYSEKSPPAKVTFLYLNGKSETLTIKEYRERTGREDLTFLTDTIKVNGNELPAKKQQYQSANGELLVESYPKATYIVDGKEVSAIVANNINATEITSVNVVKNAISNNNVVTITTKNSVNSNINTVNAIKTTNSVNNAVTVNGIKVISPKPLFILEGKEITEEEMNLIDPEKIESLTVLKDKSAETLYGEKAKNGVIVITLKKKKS